jgi:hypothetical protein
MLSEEQRAYLVETCHILAHDHGYSQVQIREWLEEQGAPRAAGTVALYMAQRCERCPEAVEIPRPRALRP